MPRAQKIFFGILCGFGIVAPVTTDAQPTTDLRIVTRSDGDVYIYFTANLPYRHGYNLYRDDADGTVRRVTEEPVRAARTAAEFQDMVGSDMKRLLHIFETDDPVVVLLRLSNDRHLGLMNAFVNPAVASALGRLVIDTTASPGSEVTYRAAIVDAQDEETGQEYEVTATLRPSFPTPPLEPRGEHAGRTVHLQWRYDNSVEEDNVVQFHVYDLAGAGVRRLAPSILRTDGTRQFRFSTEVPSFGTELRLAVTAVDMSGQESAPSDTARIMVEDNVPPGVLPHVAARLTSAGSIEISWPVAVDSDASSYFVYRSKAVTGPFIRLHDTPLALLETFYVDSLITTGKYFYSVAAVDAAGNEGKRSNAASVLVEDHTPPDPPYSLVASAESNDAVVLDWAPSLSADLSTYVVLRRRAAEPEEPFSKANDAPTTRTRYLDSGPGELGFSAGSFYEYGVLAADSAANFSDTAFVRLQIPDLTPPQPPANVSASNQDGREVHISWPASVSRDVVGYQVHRSSNGRRDSLIASTSRNRRLATDRDVAVGARYLYRVLAVDSLLNESRLSAPDTVLVRDSSPPPPVRNLSVVTQDGRNSLRWEASPAPDLAGYLIFRSATANGIYEQINTELARTNERLDPEGSAGDWYHVVVVDVSENRSRPSTRRQALP